MGVRWFVMNRCLHGVGVLVDRQINVEERKTGFRDFVGQLDGWVEIVEGSDEVGDVSFGAVSSNADVVVNVSVLWSGLSPLYCARNLFST